MVYLLLELAIPRFFNLYGYNSPRLASIFGGKFENGWFSDFKTSSSKCLGACPEDILLANLLRGFKDFEKMKNNRAVSHSSFQSRQGDVQWLMTQEVKGFDRDLPPSPSFVPHLAQK